MQRGIVGTCKWCGIASVRRPAIYWHPDCFTQYQLHTDPAKQLEYLIERDGECCAGCGGSAIKWKRGSAWGQTWSSEQKWHPPGEAEKLWPPCRKPYIRRTEDDHMIAQVCPVWPVLALEVDHFIPLWSVAHLPDDERRWYFGPDNLWLLCPTCHKFKTKREAAQRAHERRMAKAQMTLL